MAGKSDCERKAEKVRCLVFDVDGVLTDGRLILDGAGNDLKTFDVKDGQRIVMAKRRGLKVVFLSGRSSKAVGTRATELSVDRVFQGAADKAVALSQLMAQEDMREEEIGYLGDDLGDLPAMRRAGLAGAVADAAPEVIEAADWVSRRPGGRGAAREFVEFVLRSRGLWQEAAAEYGA